MFPLMDLVAHQLRLDAGGVDDGEPRGVDQGGVLGALSGLDDASQGGEQTVEADVLGFGLRCAKFGDPLGHLVFQGEAAGMPPVTHESGALVGVDQQRALGAGLGEGFVAGVLEGGHGVGYSRVVRERSEQ